MLRVNGPGIVAHDHNCIHGILKVTAAAAPYTYSDFLTEICAVLDMPFNHKKREIDINSVPF